MASQEIKVNGDAFNPGLMDEPFGPVSLSTPLYKDVAAFTSDPLSSSTLYNSADAKIDTQLEDNLDSAALRVESKTLRYPLDGSNDHFIRFYINIKLLFTVR